MNNIWKDFDFPTLDVTEVSSAGINHKMQNSTIVQEQSLSQDNENNAYVNNAYENTANKNTANENAVSINIANENITYENITYEDINWDDFPTF